MKITKKRKRYKNPKFLKALGWHCRALRVMKGYSIDRMVVEGGTLSSGSIDRLERGLADTQITVVYRYAKILDLSLNELFDFPEAAEIEKIIR